MRRNTNALRLMLAFALSGVVLLAGCSSTGPTWVDSGAGYTTQNVSDVYTKADISRYAEVSAANTTQQRHDALTALRARGGNASDAATLLTNTLPSDARGVPVYVERATFNGQPALILVEAIGPSKARLTTKRLWVLSAEGTVLFVGTR